MNYSKQVFKILNIEPGEEFYIVNQNNYKSNYKYKFNSDLELFFYDDCNEKWMSSRRAYKLLNGTERIVKIPQTTKEEQLAIDYAKACGYKWLAKDEDGSVYGYKEKPCKEISEGLWNFKGGLDCFGEIHIPISFLCWGDEEPYYIGD